MTEEVKNDEVVVSEKQQSEIADMLDDLMPVQREQNTSGEKEVTSGGDEREKRSEEEAGGQVEGAGSGKEAEKEVGKEPEPLGAVPTEEVKKPTEEAQTPPAIPDLSDLEKANREIAELRGHLEELASRTMEPAVKQPQTPEQVEAHKRQQEAAARQVLTFLKDDEVFDEVMKSSTNFNALLTSVVNTAVAKTMQLIPQVTSQYVDNQMSTRLAVKDFYTDNPDLVHHKKYVGFVSNELYAKNPTWSVEQNLVETEKEVRARLKLGKSVGPGGGLPQQNSAGRTVENNPGFVPSGGGGGRRGSVSADRLSGEDKQIMDLIS